MARHLIQNSTTGDTRIVGDAALPFFPGWIVRDTLEDGQPPFLFYTGGESDLRYVNVSEINDPESAASVALRAASVAAVQDAITAGTIEVGDPALGARSLLPRTRLAVPPQEKVLATFAAGHGWISGGGFGSINLNDTSQIGWAGQVVSGVTNGTGAGNFVTINSTGPLDVTGKIFKLLTKVSDPSKVASTELHLTDSGSAFTNTAKLTAVAGTGPTLLPGAWTVMTFTFDKVALQGAAPNYAAINAMKLRIGDTSAVINVSYGGLSMMARPEPFPNGVVTPALDDGFLSHYTFARGVLNRYRYRATFFPILDRLGQPNYMTEAQLRELVELDGSEVGGHATSLARHGQGLTGLTGSELTEELDTIRAWLADRNWSDLFAYPIGAYNAPVITEIKRRFAAARSTDATLKETPYPGAPSRLRSVPVTSGMTAAAVQAQIDEAYQHGNHLIITFHDLVASGATGYSWSQANFSQVIDYCATKGIPVRALGDVLTTR